MASSILKDDPSAPLRRAGVPEALYRTVTRCLEKSPLARYQRARDIYSDLTAARREIESGAGRSAPGADAEQAIAVLPFQNMSADPENEYFGDGIAEEIINALTQINGLRVAARTSSFSFKGKSAAIGEIAEKLKVRHVLEGSVRKAGNRVRIAAQLVEASTGYQLWSERYDRQLEDIFDVQDEIARTIVERLKVAFSVAPAERLVKASTTNMEAYQLYLKGRASLVQARGVDRTRSREFRRPSNSTLATPTRGRAWPTPTRHMVTTASPRRARRCPARSRPPGGPSRSIRTRPARIARSLWPHCYGIAISRWPNGSFTARSPSIPRTHRPAAGMR